MRLRFGGDGWQFFDSCTDAAKFFGLQVGIPGQLVAGKAIKKYTDVYEARAPQTREDRPANWRASPTGDRSAANAFAALADDDADDDSHDSRSKRARDASDDEGGGKRARDVSSPPPHADAAHAGAKKPATVFAVGDAVWAKYLQPGLPKMQRSKEYFRGQVSAVSSPGVYAISFDDGDFDKAVPVACMKTPAEYGVCSQTDTGWRGRFGNVVAVRQGWPAIVTDPSNISGNATRNKAIEQTEKKYAVLLLGQKCNNGTPKYAFFEPKSLKTFSHEADPPAGLADDALLEFEEAVQLAKREMRSMGLLPSVSAPPRGTRVILKYLNDNVVYDCTVQRNESTGALYVDSKQFDTEVDGETIPFDPNEDDWCAFDLWGQDV
mmetsp:Transcript_5338/g.18914  ORF Transcript_5338/g.18914 Transcript_5338/m.18914 type:complete len:379 (+) Transcript_5338:40-1176(+)